MSTNTSVPTGALLDSKYRRQLIAIDSRNRNGFDPTVQIWTSNTVYAEGAKVLVVATGYVCIVAHTSSVLFETDLNNGVWRPTAVSSPSKYTIRFPAVRNVKSIRMVTSEMPNTQYIINHKNRNLDFIDTATATTYTANITMGTYTTTTLADELNTRMNYAMGVGFGVNFSVTYSTIAQRLVITRNGGTTFALLFNTGPYGTSNLNKNPAVVLGFTPGFDTPLLVQQTSTSIVNIAGENFTFMTVKNYPAIQTSSNVIDCFAKIVWDVIPRNITFDSFVSNPIIYTVAKDVVDSFDVSFVDFSGQYYDFNNIDHSYTIEFMCEQ